MSTWAEYSCLVPRPASLAGWVPVSLVWAMLVWVSKKLTWCEQLIHDYTTHESVPFTANKDISTFATENPCFTSFKAATLRVGWEQDPVRHYMPGCCTPFSWPPLSPPCHSLCSQLVRFPLATAELHGHISSVRGRCLPGVPPAVLTLRHPGVYLGSTMPFSPQAAVPGIPSPASHSLRGGNDTEPLKIWVPQGLNRGLN